MSNLSIEEFYQRQALPLRIKLLLTNQRIRDWVDEYGEENVCILFKARDIRASNALVHMVTELFPNIRVEFDVCSSSLKPIVPWMAENEADIADWVQNGCNHFESKFPESRPLAFWTEKDIKEYTDGVINGKATRKEAHG